MAWTARLHEVLSRIGKVLSGEASPVTGVERLVADGRLLSAYLAAAGLLRSQTLDDRIAAVEQGDRSVAAVARLRLEVSKATRTARQYIALLDLRAHKSPFERGLRTWRNKLTQIIVSILTLLLVVSVVIGFAIYEHVVRDISEAQRILAQNPTQKIGDLRRMLQEGALNDPRKAYYLQYQRAEGELRAMFDSADDIMRRSLLTDSGSDSSKGLLCKVYGLMRLELFGRSRPRSTNLLVPIGADAVNAASAAGELWNGVVKGKAIGSKQAAVPEPPGLCEEDFGVAGQLASAGFGGVVDATGAASAPGRDKVVSDTKAVTLTDPSQAFEECRNNGANLRKYYEQASKELLALQVDLLDDYCLSLSLGVNTLRYRSASIITTIRNLQDELFLIGVLFLPMAGGLLGACIFVVNYVMNNRLGPTLGPGSVGFRVVAGGACGVIIGWFASGSGGTVDPAHVSGTPFTLAFLAGFSIDTLSTVILRFGREARNSRPVDGPADDTHGQQHVSTDAHDASADAGAKPAADELNSAGDPPGKA